MSNFERKENWFVRSLIVVFCIFIASMIGFSYFGVEPKGQINSGVVTLLLLLLILVLSESFDNFSIGKLISITREVNKKEKEVQKIEKEKSELLTQLITISNTQRQTQQHTNVYGDYHAGKGVTVERASAQEVKDKVTDEQPRPNAVVAPEYRTDWQKIEQIAMQKYILQKGIHAANIITEAKLVTQFYGIDPVSNHQPIFDGYYKNDNKEIFIEFRVKRGFHMIIRDRIYMMLSKLNHYQNVKNASVHLDFVLINIPEDENNAQNMNRFLQDFEPAIASGILRINEVKISQEEMDLCKSKI